MPLPDVQILTLTYLPDRGWRIFSHGPATEADRIKFPTGSLFVDSLACEVSHRRD